MRATLTLATNEGFTAVFGAPVAQEDHARRAVLVALDLHQRMQERGDLHAGGVLALRMGVHSGHVVVGALGLDSRRHATAVGTPLHVAAQLQQQAAPGTILLSAATYQLVCTEIRAVPARPRTLAGQPMAVYTVQGLLRRQAGVVGQGLRAASPFVGRERELALLQDHLALACGGQGQVVGLVGAPGIGKTRLLTEFCRRVPANQVTVYEGQCLSYGQGTPYLSVRDLVRQVCGLAEGGERAALTATVQQRLRASGMTADDDLALLLQLLDLPVALEGLMPLSPEARQVRTFALLRHLILEAAQRQPLVLVVENLHWSDPTSAAWLASLVERLPEAAVLLLGTYRPGYQPVWGEHTAVTQIAVPSLRAQESRTVVQAVLGTVALPETRLRAIVAQAGGNPFFLEELAWHAVTQEGRDTSGVVPETVHAVLAARLDQLPAEVKRLLQTAAVIGIEVPFPLLRAMADVPDEALHRGLAHLQAAEFLYETQLLPAPAYTFKHALTHEVVYSSLFQERRCGLHTHIVAALEGDAGDGGAAQVERLAYHALRGQVWAKAVTYCRQAGTKAYTASAYREAVGYWEQALEALGHLPPDRITLEQAADVHGDLYHALHALTQYARMLTHLRAAEVLAEGLADPRRLGSIYRSLANTLRYLEDYDPALTYSQRAHALATACGDVGLQRESRLAMGWIAYNLGHYPQALEHFCQVLRTLQEAPDTQAVGLGHGLGLGLGHRTGNRALMTCAWMVRCLIALGAFAEAVTSSNEARQLAEAGDQPFEYLVLYRCVGLLHVRQGTVDQAITVLERAVALGREADISLNAVANAVQLALAYALAGRATDALPLLGQIEGFEVFRGEAYLYIGEVEEAGRLAQRGLAHARAHNRRGWEAWALWVLGETARHRDLPAFALAAAHYQQAQAQAEALGMRPLQAHCHRGLGTLYARIGQREQARAALSTAIAMYRSMEMTFWLPQAEATLAQIGGAEKPEGGVP